MKPINIPGRVRNVFLEVAKKNVNAIGQVVETLAFLYGHETDEALIADGILFPVQEGDFGRVTDLGEKRTMR